MAFQCPSCGGKKLEIAFSLELPPSPDDDEITLQTLKCAGCALHAIAVYRESRHGSLDSESWQHDGYPIGDAEFKALEEILRLCPSPRNRLCQCSTHVSFARQNWASPVHLGIDATKRFEMRLVR